MSFRALGPEQGEVNEKALGIISSELVLRRPGKAEETFALG